MASDAGPVPPPTTPAPSGPNTLSQPNATGWDQPDVLSWDAAPPGVLVALVDLERRVNRATSQRDEAPWQLNNFTRSLPGKRELSLVAMRGRATVGFLVASRKPGGVRVHRIAVDPELCWPAVASALLARLLARAAGTVTVRCDRRDDRAVALYRRAGFRVTGRNRSGLLSLSTRPLPNARQLRLWYVYPAGGPCSGHAAQVPDLVDAMSRISPTTAVGYGDPADLPVSGQRRRVVSSARLLRQATRERVDVMLVRTHWMLAGLLALAGRLGGGWRVVLWLSGGTGPGDGRAPDRRARLVSPVRRLVIRYLVHAVVTGSPGLAREYRDRTGLPPRRLLLSCDAVNGDRWRASAGDHPGLRSRAAVRQWLGSAYRFLYVGALDSSRGADRLPLLRDRLRRELGDAELLVLGDGPLYGRLLAADLLLVGAAAQSDIAWAMPRAHCLLVPSRREGFPRVLVQAMAVGLPCVSFDTGGCADVMGPLHDDYLAADGDVGRFITLAARAARGHTVDGPSAALIARAAMFDTAPVATALAAALRSLRFQGAAPASWLSRSLWSPQFPTYQQLPSRRRDR